MNITLNGTKITQDTRNLAFEKNNNVDEIVVTVDTDESWSYKLDVKYPDKYNIGNDALYNIIDLDRNGNICSAILDSKMLPFNGKYTMQLRGINGDKVYHSDIFEVWVKYSIEPGSTYNPVPSEFYQVENRLDDKVDEAKQYAENAEIASTRMPKISSDNTWLIWDVGTGDYVDTGVAASGGDIVRIELADYGLYFGGEGVSVPQEFVDILRDALDNRKAPYVHGAVAEGMEGTVLLDTMYTANGLIFASGVGVLVLEGVTPAWFALCADTEALTVSIPWGILEGEEGPQGPEGPPGPAGAPGADGSPGADGYSPTIDVSRGDDKTVLTITDVNGTKTADIPDGKQGPVGKDGTDGAPGKDNLPNVETLAGSEQSLELAYNVEHRFSDALTSLTITGFGAPTESGKVALYSIVFTASADGVTVTLPDTILWAVAEPVFTAGCTYWLTITELGGKYLAVWVEVPANG